MGKVDEIPLHLRFLFGASANCTATAVTHPMDVLKVRLQLDGQVAAKKTRLVHCAQSVFQLEGTRGFFRGLSPAFLRQIFYGGTRLTVYDIALDYASDNDGTPPPLYIKAPIALTADILYLLQNKK